MTVHESAARPEERHLARIRPALLAGLFVAAVTLVILLANAHLVYVAVTSQPECVAHVKGDGPSEHGQFRAAKSAC